MKLPALHKACYTVTIPGIGASGSWSGPIPSGTWCVRFPPIMITDPVTIDLDTGVPAPTTVTQLNFTGWEFDNRDVTVTRDAAVIYP